MITFPTDDLSNGMEAAGGGGAHFFRADKGRLTVRAGKH
jgi:hypothetical protein